MAYKISENSARRGKPNLFLSRLSSLRKGKTYKEIYGNRWQEEIEKRRKTNLKRWDKVGRIGYFRRPRHSHWVYKNFVKKVFERDNYICQICKKRKIKLNADHYPKPFIQIIKENNIKNMPVSVEFKELWYINNGKTHCIDCHKKTDTYGKRAKNYGKKVFSLPPQV